MTMTTFADTWSLASLPALSAARQSQKKGRNRQSGTPWTRSGCLTCKKRRKGCDKAKPSCNNCIKQGRKCEGYGDLWVQPLGPSAQIFKQPEGSRRRRLDISSPSQTPPPSSPSLHSYLDTWSDTQSSPGSVSLDWSVFSSPQRRSVNNEEAFQKEEASNTQDVAQIPRLQDSLAIVSRPQSYPAPSHLSDSESHYLQYHVEFGSRLLANLESDDNPLRSLLIPRAMSSPLLMKAVCAVSALHLANRSQGFSAQTAAARFYGRALSGTRTAIAECSTDMLSDDAMLAVGLMCKYEVVRGSVKQWVVHLSALQRLIASRGGLNSMDREAAEFLRGLYVYAYSMARISNGRRITYSDPADTDIGSPRLDIYVGYTEEILKLCARIAELPSLGDDTISLRLAIASINDALLDWSHTSTRYIIPQSLTPATLTRLQLVAECFRDAAFIFLHSTLERMSMGSSFHSSSSSQDTETTPLIPIELPLLGNAPSSKDWTSLISTAKSTAIHRCLARVESLPFDNHCEYSALTFPLFISGCESDVLEHRGLIMESLGKLQDNFGIGNVQRAKEVLRILWERRDADVHVSAGVGGPGPRKVHWMDILDELQWELILA